MSLRPDPAGLADPGSGTDRTAGRVSALSLDGYARDVIAQGVDPLYARALVNGFGPHLGYRLARSLVRLDAPSPDLRAVIAAADRADAASYRRGRDAGCGRDRLPGTR